MKLVESKTFRRKIRTEDWSELGVSTLIKLKEAIEGGGKEDALELANYLKWEGKPLHDFLRDFAYGLLTYIGDNYGEEEIYKAYRYCGEALRKKSIMKMHTLPLNERVQIQAEVMRAHWSGPGEWGDIHIEEQEDRFVMTLDPCGAGGVMTRTGDIDKYNFGRTKKAYPWSWGKAGVPYYCVHCCVWSEIQSIEWIGYPIRVAECPENPEEPCAIYFYKSPELIPEKYFLRVGKTKDRLGRL